MKGVSEGINFLSGIFTHLMSIQLEGENEIEQVLKGLEKRRIIRRTKEGLWDLADDVAEEVSNEFINLAKKKAGKKGRRSSVEELLEAAVILTVLRKMPLTSDEVSVLAAIAKSKAENIRKNREILERYHLR